MRRIPDSASFHKKLERGANCKPGFGVGKQQEIKELTLQSRTGFGKGIVNAIANLFVPLMKEKTNEKV